MNFQSTGLNGTCFILESWPIAVSNSYAFVTALCGANAGYALGALVLGSLSLAGAQSTH